MKTRAVRWPATWLIRYTWFRNIIAGELRRSRRRARFARAQSMRRLRAALPTWSEFRCKT